MAGRCQRVVPSDTAFLPVLWQPCFYCCLLSVFTFCLSWKCWCLPTFRAEKLQFTSFTEIWYFRDFESRRQPEQECYTSLNREIAVWIQSLRLFLCSQEVPYLLRNSWMVHVPNRCLACICLEVMELLMEAIPWDKGFFRFAYPAWSLALCLSLSSRVFQLSALYLQREIHPSCFRWETYCLSPLTMEKAYIVK